MYGMKDYLTLQVWIEFRIDFVRLLSALQRLPKWLAIIGNWDLDVRITLKSSVWKRSTIYVSYFHFPPINSEKFRNEKNKWFCIAQRCNVGKENFFRLRQGVTPYLSLMECYKKFEWCPCTSYENHHEFERNGFRCGKTSTS